MVPILNSPSFFFLFYFCFVFLYFHSNHTHILFARTISGIVLLSVSDLLPIVHGPSFMFVAFVFVRFYILLYDVQPFL